MPHGVGVPLCIMQMREHVCVGGRGANIQACAKVTFTPTAEAEVCLAEESPLFSPLVFTLFSN